MIDEEQERLLRLALDECWGELTKDQLSHLEPETKDIARANHQELYHKEQA